MKALLILAMPLLVVEGVAAQGRFPDVNPDALRGADSISAYVQLTWDDEIDRRGGPNEEFREA